MTRTGSAFDFNNAAGRQLSGVLQTGPGIVRAYAIFAHCFTCDKRSLAAVRISEALADRGIAVLRFDFTGLGMSQGEFGGGLSSDAQDIVMAAEAMTAAGMEPRLLIGHSLGGAAVLAAAGAIPSTEAVAVIGAPFDAEHVLAHIGTALDDVSEEGRAPVSIAGRTFFLGRGFIEDLREQPQEKRIAKLDRPLLVLHSPVDQIVPIEHASRIFQAAHHPKSFLSLGDADHLLVREADGVYAASVIAAWADRYLPAAEDAPALTGYGIRAEETGAGKFQVRVVSALGSWLVDERASAGGLGSAPSPYDMVSAGLSACTAMTCRLYADRKGLPLERVVVEVRHLGRYDVDPDRFLRKISLEGPLDEKQRSLLMAVADRCPVHRTLTEGASVATGQGLFDTADDAVEPAADHAQEMERVCFDDEPPLDPSCATKVLVKQ